MNVLTHSATSIVESLHMTKKDMATTMSGFFRFLLSPGLWLVKCVSYLQYRLTGCKFFNNSVNAHHSVSCNVVNDGQMLLIGGWFPNGSYNACDVPPIWGMHNLNLGMNNVEAAPWYQYRKYLAIRVSYR